MTGVQHTETSDAPVRADIAERANRLLRLAAGGNPTGMLVEGTRGTGKTYLAASVAGEARLQSFRVAEVDARWSVLPFHAIDQLVRQLGVETADEREGIGLLHAFRLACQRASVGHAGVALIIDNAHLLTAEDVAVLYDAFLSPPIEGLFVLLTASSNADQHISSLDFVRGTGGRRLYAEWVQFEPLTLPEVAAAAERRFPGHITRRFVQAIHHLAAGNTRYLFALLDAVARLATDERDHVTSGSETIDKIQVPTALADELLGSFERVGPSAPLIAQALAVLRQPAESGEICALLELPPGDIEGTLVTLEQRGLIRSIPLTDDRLLFDFAIPLAAVVARGLLPPLTRRKFNRATARIKERVPPREPEPAQALALNYLDGVMPLTRKRAEWSIAVAERLVIRSRYHVARRILEDVLRRADPRMLRQARVRALTALAETLSRTGSTMDSGDALDAALAIERRADDVSEPLIRKARDAMALGHSELAAQILEEVLKRDDLSHQTRLRVMTDLSKLLLVDRFDEERGRQLAAAAYDSAISAEDWPIAIDDDIAIHVSHLHAGRPRLALDHGRRALINAHQGDAGASMLARAVAAIGHALMDASTLERGLHWTRRAHVAAEQAEDLATASWTSQLGADRSLENGDWDGAARWIKTAIQLDSSLHRERSLIQSRALDARLDAARETADEYWSDPDHFPDPANIQDSHITWVPVFIAHFEHVMLGGNFSVAAELIDQTAAELRGHSLGARTLVVDVLPRIAESARELGDESRLRAVSDELGALANELGSELLVATPAHLLAQSHLAQAEGNWSQAMMAAAEAAAQFQHLGYHWRAARCDELAGEAAMRLNQAQAVEHLTRAYRFYNSVGARKHLALTRQGLRTLGASLRREPRDRSGLTTRQLEIAGYAAAGETDGEIAERLSISRRTVTTHMHNILGRLDLESRRQLSTWFDEETEPHQAFGALRARRPTS